MFLLVYNSHSFYVQKKLKLKFTALLFICWCMLIWCINLFCLHSCTLFDLSKFSDNGNNLILPLSRKTKCLVAKLMFRLMIASCLSWISFTRRIYYNIRRRFFYLDNIWLQLPFINTEQERENKKIGRIYFTEQQISLHKKCRIFFTETHFVSLSSRNKISIQCCRNSL